MKNWQKFWLITFCDVFIPLSEHIHKYNHISGPLPSELWNHAREIDSYDNVDSNGILSSSKFSNNNGNPVSSDDSVSSTDDDNGNESDDEGTYDTKTMQSELKFSKSKEQLPTECKTIPEPLRQACEVANSYLIQPDFYPSDVKPVSCMF